MDSESQENFNSESIHPPVALSPIKQPTHVDLSSSDLSISSEVEEKNKKRSKRKSLKDRSLNSDEQLAAEIKAHRKSLKEFRHKNEILFKKALNTSFERIRATKCSTEDLTIPIEPELNTQKLRHRNSNQCNDNDVTTILRASTKRSSTQKKAETSFVPKKTVPKTPRFSKLGRPIIKDKLLSKIDKNKLYLSNNDSFIKQLNKLSLEKAKEFKARRLNKHIFDKKNNFEKNIEKLREKKEFAEIKKIIRNNDFILKKGEESFVAKTTKPMTPKLKSLMKHKDFVKKNEMKLKIEEKNNEQKRNFKALRNPFVEKKTEFRVSYKGRPKETVTSKNTTNSFERAQKRKEFDAIANKKREEEEKMKEKFKKEREMEENKKFLEERKKIAFKATKLPYFYKKKEIIRVDGIVGGKDSLKNVTIPKTPDVLKRKKS